MDILELDGNERLDLNTSTKVVIVKDIRNHVTITSKHKISMRVTGSIGESVCLFLGPLSKLIIDAGVTIGRELTVEIKGLKAKIVYGGALPPDANVEPCPVKK